MASVDAAQCDPVNDDLVYLVDRRYSPRTVRCYAFDPLQRVVAAAFGHHE